MIRELHFPTPIYIFDIKDKNINIDLEKNILTWYKQDKGISRTNVNGWHSTTDMHQKPEYERLVKALYEAQNKIYKEEHYESEPVLGNMWANINPPGGMNRSHQHPNSLWSGVYYIKAPKNSGYLKIDDPRASAAMYRPRQKDGEKPIRLLRETQYEPIAGRLIMFPSWLLHCVDPNNSDDIRISVSFNFLQKGMFV
nr:Putative 2OG-Fe(II) oxygenase [uncultured Mediterranean phage uvMED]